MIFLLFIIVAGLTPAATLNHQSDPVAMGGLTLVMAVTPEPEYLHRLLPEPMGVTSLRSSDLGEARIQVGTVYVYTSQSLIGFGSRLEEVGETPEPANGIVAGFVLLAVICRSLWRRRCH